MVKEHTLFLMERIM